jgi:hypothetical protein
MILPYNGQHKIAIGAFVLGARGILTVLRLMPLVSLLRYWTNDHTDPLTFGFCF